MAPRLEFRMVGEYHVITSPDMPALHVGHVSREKAVELVPEQIEVLKSSAKRRTSRERVKRPVSIAAQCVVTAVRN